MKVLGVDLAAYPKNSTGVCILKNNQIVLKTVKTDKEILDNISEVKPVLVAIDAPIMDSKPHMRKADGELKKYGALSPALPGMKTLTLRASRLVKKIDKPKVIEVFPTATQKIIGVYNKDYRVAAKQMNVSPNNKHEFDAYICSVTGKLFLQGKTVEVGDENGKIVLPSKEL
ncbi:MAG: DUF429 domain-containing protein [Candidatus Thermoplasmatota archaeon]